MAFSDIASGIKYPDKASERFKRLDAFDRLRDGTLYEHIRFPFEEEYSSNGGEYIPMRKRRPSVVWQAASMLCAQLAGLLWGDEQMPVVRTYSGEEPTNDDKEAESAIQHISEALALDTVMETATHLSSSGSCAIVLRATDDKEPYIEVVPGKECTPKFNPRSPMEMLEFEQLYPTTGHALADMGYDIDDDKLDDVYWFRLTIDSREEVRYFPLTNEDYEDLGKKRSFTDRKIQWVRDEERSFEHGFGAVPVIWAKAPSRGVSKLDGDCLYGKVADIFVSIDYNLSQIQRGFRYTADPMLAIRRGELKNGAVPFRYEQEDQTSKDGEGNIIKSSSTVLDIEPGGEAKLLEISGQGLDKFRELVRMLREWGLEVVGGMKADAESTKGGDSGRVLEIMFQNMILLLKRWRVSLGNNAYIPLIRLVLVGIAMDVIEIPGVDSVAPDTTMRLIWQNWMTPTGQDLNATVQAWQALAGYSAREPGPILPRETVTRIVAGNLGLTDTAAVLTALGKQVDDDAKKLAAQQDKEQQNAVELKTAGGASSDKGNSQ
ncbi:MAG: hypothetical protein KGL39_22055 [Patescibacteria group bacterium]|nr:hypothetical protein [Patescibacteria group bacterium]